MIESSRSRGDDLLGDLVRAEQLDAFDDALALAVVAEPARLHERGHAGLVERAEARRRDPERPEELLLDETVLAELERTRVRNRSHAPRRLDGDVLELVRDRVGAVCEAVEELRIAVGPDDELPHLTGARVRRRVEEAEAHAEPRPCEREHAPELAAPDAPDEVRHVDGSGAASTASVWLARYAASRSRTPSSERATIAAASSPALTAPARPIASVPTGTPAGI